MHGFHLSQKLLCVFMCFVELFAAVILMQVFTEVIFGNHLVENNAYVTCAFGVSIFSVFMTMAILICLYHRQAKELL